MKVLYISYHRTASGWGTAARNYILALDSVGVEVVPRAIGVHDEAEVPERILELEDNNESGCNVCIQHVLPHFMERGDFDLNIGMFACETSHFRNTHWAHHLNMMDEAWVFHRDGVDACRNSHVNVPIQVIPHCFDLSRYSQRYTPYPIPEVANTFVFYTIGEVIRRKNLAGLLKAFHLEFAPHEPVSLLIKGGIPGVSPAQAQREIRGLIDGVKTGLRLYPHNSAYHNEILVTQRLTEYELMRLHKTGNCFVLPSHGEAWCIPGFEAMAMGNPTILSMQGGPKDFISDGDSGVLVDGYYEPCFIQPSEAPLPDVWLGNEDWFTPNIELLRKEMRLVYEDREWYERLSTGGIDRAYNYGYEQVGQQMKGLIEHGQ